ncbi:MAG: hypothetical protein B6I32_04505 [Desulfobacterium sp. 4572_20]|nr:MAG: hypothetical protein B6I32_04505 [Desulfobacterium sp. 4572_20]
MRDYDVKFCKKNSTEMDCLLTGTVRGCNTGRILGYQGIIKTKNLSDKHDSAVRMIQELGERMLGFIDRTRDLFQMEKGSYMLKPQEVNILSLLQRIKKHESLWH